MSNRVAAQVVCPACGIEESRPIFDSLNGPLLPDLVEAIARGTFEQNTCGACDHRFQPEHRMLLSHLPLNAWIVMQPWQAQQDAAQHEADVLAVFDAAFAAPPAAIAAQTTQVRPRLVFGQVMLAEAVRLVGLQIEPGLMECAKLLWMRRNLDRFLAWGPAHLCMELPFADRFECGVYAIGTGARIDTLQLSTDLLAEVRSQRAECRIRMPQLFDRPYVSAMRALLG